MTIRIIVAIVSLVGTAVMLTVYALSPERRVVLFWYLFGCVFVTGFMTSNVLTNMSYVYKD